MRTSMSLSEKPDDMVRKQEQSLFKKKIITEMKEDGQIQFFLTNPSNFSWSRGTVKVA